MAAPLEAWGIDVGQVALKALKIRELGDKVEALAYEYIPHARILSQSGDDADTLIRDALAKFLSRNALADTPVAIGVPGHHTLARFTKLPPVDAKKVPSIVRYEAEQQIPFDLSEVIWDYQLFRGDASPELEVGIFAMKRDLIASHLLPFTATGVVPTILQSSPLATFNALLFDGLAAVSEDRPSEGVVILDVGAVNTDLVIAAGNGLWTRTIQIGGNSFTQALVKVFKLSFTKAENLKKSAPTSKYARQVFQAMRPVFADLVAEVQRSLGFYGSTRRDVKIVRLIGMGNAFKLPGLQKFIQQNLGIEVIKPDRFNKLVPTSGSHPKDVQENLLGFGVPYGLALQGLDRSRVTSNLLPAEISRRSTWQKKNPWFAAAAACLLLCAGIIWARQFIDESALATAIGDFKQVRTLSFQQARDRKGSIRDAPARELAGDWLGIARAFKKEMEAKTTEEKQLAERLDRFVVIEKDKGLFLEILDAVHRALPEPKTPADRAASSAEFEARASEDDSPRAERGAIYIDQFESLFDPQIIGFAFDSADEEEEGLGNDYGYDDESFDPPGFAIQLTLRCTNKDSKYIDRTFVDSLKKTGRDPDSPFYFDFIRVTDRRQLRGSSGQEYVLRDSTRRSGGSIGRGRPKGSRSSDNTKAGLLDPVTGESMETDWRYRLSMVVVLSAPPDETEGGTEGDKERKRGARKRPDDQEDQEDQQEEEEEDMDDIRSRF